MVIAQGASNLNFRYRSNLKRVTEVTSKSYESNPLGRNGSNRIGRGKGYYRTDAGGIGRNRKIGY